MSILLKAYQDANGELVMVEEGSFQDTDSVAGGLTRVPGKDVTVSNDLSTNEDLEAKVNQSQIVDDSAFSAPSATDVPSTSSVKSYVDAQVAGKDEASEISYDNSTSGLSATNVQAAIDEVEGRVETNETNIGTNTTDIGTNATNVTELTANQNDLITLTGVAENSVNLGTFSGSIIGDNVTIKTALQELETQASSTRVTDVFVVADIAARDALTGIDEGDVAVVLDDGTGKRHSYIYDGTNWVDLKTGDTVTSVNGQNGDVVLTTDNINEGSTNLYFTDGRARNAAVVNSTAGSETDQAPSVSAIKAYVTAGLAAQDEASEISFDNSVNGFTATDVQGAIEEAKDSSNKEYIYANQTVAQTSIGGTAENLIFDNEAIQSAGSIFTLNVVNGEIAVSKDGVYKVEYMTTNDTEDGARRTTETILEINTGSGFVELSSSLGSARAYTYNRNNASGENTASAQAMLSLSSGDSVRVRIRRSNGTGLIKTVPTGTSISIEEK